MTPDAEILSAAMRIIRDHGPDAAGAAAGQAAKLWREGDKTGWAMWRVIATTTRTIQADDPVHAFGTKEWPATTGRRDGGGRKA